MNLAFNELSFQPLVENEYVLTDRFLNMAKTFMKANDSFGFSHIVFPTDIGVLKVTSQKTLYEWANQISNKNEKNIILSLIKKPFTNDILNEQSDRVNEYYFENQELGIEQTYCNGLSMAHITEVPSISLGGEAFWEQIQINFFRENINTNIIENVTVLNISIEDSLNNSLFSLFAESTAQYSLVESSLLPTQKSISFRPDHGTDILTAFANRLINSTYVISVINSLPFNPKTVRFIRNVFNDGKIEIVLHWEDAGFGMLIQTTGRNYRETKAIAEILQNEYDR